MLPPEVDALYDAFKHPRAERPPLPLLPPVEARAYDHEAALRGRGGSSGAEPVQHVSYFEAEAYARWAGAGCPPRPSGRRRARGTPVPRARRAWPWGSPPPGPDLVNLGGVWGGRRLSGRTRLARRPTGPSR